MNRSPDLSQSLSQITFRLVLALSRIESIGKELQSGESTDIELAREALLFNLERASWAAIELANLWVFQARIGIPRKEAEGFDLLSKAGLLPLDTARKLKYAAEYRGLSHRNAELLNWEHFEGGLSSDLELLRDWSRIVQRQLTASAPKAESD